MSKTWLNKNLKPHLFICNWILTAFFFNMYKPNQIINANVCARAYTCHFKQVPQLLLSFFLHTSQFLLTLSHAAHHALYPRQQLHNPLSAYHCFAAKKNKPRVIKYIIKLNAMELKLLKVKIPSSVHINTTDLRCV